MVDHINTMTKKAHENVSPTRYEGEWKAGKPVGSGVLIQFRVEVPVEWIDGKPVPMKPYVERPKFTEILKKLV
jgi:hypothetical protein